VRYPLIFLSWPNCSPLASTWKRYATISTTTYALASYTNPVSLSSARSAQPFKLQALTVLDQPLDDEIEDDDEKNDELGQLHIRQLLQMVLQDAQTRLFFKAQSVIQSEIRYYVPTAQDLAYPDSVAAQGATTGNEIREKQSISKLFEGPGLNRRETWFRLSPRPSGYCRNYTIMFRHAAYVTLLLLGPLWLQAITIYGVCDFIQTDSCRHLQSCRI
jgi:hypothetical protein